MQKKTEAAVWPSSHMGSETPKVPQSCSKSNFQIMHSFVDIKTSNTITDFMKLQKNKGQKVLISSF